jgi:SOS response regulatory protein OraA/RecX
MSKLTSKKKKKLSQEQQAARQLQQFVDGLGVDREKIIKLGDVAQGVIKQPEAWPAFAEVLREDPATPINYQLLSQLAAMGAAAAREDKTEKAGKAPTRKPTMDELASLGRRGDTELAHVNTQEKAMLEAMGGAGTINPYTGMPEYGWLDDVWEGIKDVGSWVDDNVLQPVKNFVVENPAIVSLATTFLIPGLGTAIGTALGASGTAAAALGAAVISGGTTALSGGDLKDIFLSAGLGAGSAVLAPVIGGSLAPGASQAVQQAVSGAVIGGGASALRGGNAAEILRAAVTGGAVGYVSNIANEAMGRVTNPQAKQQTFEDAAFAAADAAQLKAAGLSQTQIAQTLQSTGMMPIPAEQIAQLTAQGKSAAEVTASMTNGYTSQSLYKAGAAGNTNSITAGNVDAYQRAEDAAFIAEDVISMKAQGLNSAQIRDNLIAAGVQPNVAGQAANYTNSPGYDAANIASSLQKTWINSDVEFFKPPAATTAPATTTTPSGTATTQQPAAPVAPTVDPAIEDAAFVAADARQLADQGLSQAQIQQTLQAAGVNSDAAYAAAFNASRGMDEANLSTNLARQFTGQDIFTAAPVAPTAPATDAGVTDAEFAAYDAEQLAAQGLSPDQIAQTLNYSGMDTQAAVDAAQLAGQGLNASDIANNLDQAYGGNIYTNETPTFTEPGMTGLPAPIDDRSVVSQETIDRINAGETSLLDSLTPTQIAALVGAGALGAAALGLGQAEQPAPRSYAPIDIPEFGGPAMINTQNLGVNPGLITAQPFYQTTNQAQPQYFWGDRPYVQTAQDLANYNAVPYAPSTPFGYNVQMPQTQPISQSVGEFLTAPEQQYAAIGTSPQYAGGVAPATTYQPSAVMPVSGAVAPAELFAAPAFYGATPPTVNTMIAPYYTTQGVTQ